jgi:hypothetical protein
MKAALFSLLASLVLACSAHSGETVNFQNSKYSGVVGVGSADKNSRGFVTIKTTETGAYSLKGKFGSRKINRKGTFSPSGDLFEVIEVKVFGFVVASVTLDLQLSADANAITGTVLVKVQGQADQTFDVEVYRALFGPRNPTDRAGRFTARLRTDTIPGHGYFLITITASGLSRVVGKVPDGSAISTGGALVSRDALVAIPIANVLYNNKGALGGFISFTTVDRAEGELSWVGLAGAATQLPELAGPFNRVLIAEAHRYARPAEGTRVLSTFEDGSLVVEFQSPEIPGTNRQIQGINLSTSNKVTVDAPNDEKTRVKLNTQTGFVSGTSNLDLGAETRTKVKFAGVILQFDAANVVSTGFFRGNNTSGRLTLATP